MRIVDFKAELTPDGQIAVPPEIASQVPAGESIQVVLQWGVSEDEIAWRDAGRGRFEAAYSADDSVYEQLLQLPTDPPDLLVNGGLLPSV